MPCFHGRRGELPVSGTGCRMAAPCLCCNVEHGASRWMVWFHDDAVQFVYEVTPCESALPKISLHGKGRSMKRWDIAHA